jgi:NAD(P)-dependent dehydrogenase (short-subunit alcohol dehydrogenase family)
MEFRDKIVIITGSGRGIGRAIAMEYAFAGAITVIAETDPFSGASTTEEINKLYGKSYFIRTDVSKPDEIEELFKRIAEQFERIDIIINNTGISVWKSPYDITLEEWDQVINTNLRSTFLCSREAAKS